MNDLAQDALTLQVELTPGDLVEALGVHQWTPSTRSSLLSAAAITGVGLLTRWNGAATWVWGGCFALGALILLLTAGLPLFVLLHWRRNRDVYGPATLVVDGQGLRGMEEQGEAHLQWSAFTRLREGKRLFLLYRSPAYFIVLPKRAFASSSDVDRFRALADDRLPPG